MTFLITFHHYLYNEYRLYFKIKKRLLHVYNLFLTSVTWVQNCEMYKIRKWVCCADSSKLGFAGFVFISWLVQLPLLTGDVTLRSPSPLDGPVWTYRSESDTRSSVFERQRGSLSRHPRRNASSRFCLQSWLICKHTSASNCFPLISVTVADWRTQPVAYNRL